jgi:hypothetical protein
MAPSAPTCAASARPPINVPVASTVAVIVRRYLRILLSLFAILSTVVCAQFTNTWVLLDQILIVAPEHARNKWLRESVLIESPSLGAEEATSPIGVLVDERLAHHERIRLNRYWQRMENHQTNL